MNKFKEGDTVIILNPTGWGAQKYTVDKVQKVYKTGNFLLANDGKNQWRQDGTGSAESRWSRRRLELATTELLAELDKAILQERSRRSLNKLGDVLQRIRDDEEGSKLWDAVPDELKALAIIASPAQSDYEARIRAALVETEGGA